MMTVNNNCYLYEKAIADCERRIGSYVAGGGSAESDYVKTQIKKIDKYTDMLLNVQEDK